VALALFMNKENQYFSWIRANPNGFVLNTTRHPDPKYMVRHRATCATVERYLGLAKPGAFTEREFIKVCSTNVSSLRRWAKANGANQFSAHCSHCKALDAQVAATAEDELENYYTALEAAAAKASADPEARRKRLASAPSKPKTMTIKARVFVRNPDVVAEVLARAGGQCEACNQPAPFLRGSDGSPYLEVHHRTSLVDDGDDTVENAEALCPNCHRKVHFGSTTDA